MASGTSAKPGFVKDAIFDEQDLSFDSGDKLNGSLYLATIRNEENGVDHNQVIGVLRQSGLWSTDDPKQVADEQRAAYKEQLEFIQAIEYRDTCGNFIAARFDHPKYPSDESRWLAWLDCLDSVFTRVIEE